MSTVGPRRLGLWARSFPALCRHLDRRFRFVGAETIDSLAEPAKCRRKMDGGRPLVATLSNYICPPRQASARLIFFHFLYAYLGIGRTHSPNEGRSSLCECFCVWGCVCACAVQLGRYIHVCACAFVCLSMYWYWYMCAGCTCVYVLGASMQACICEHWHQNVHLYFCMTVYLLVWLLVSKRMCVNITFWALAFFCYTLK